MRRIAVLLAMLAAVMQTAGVAEAQRRGRIIIRPQVPPAPGPRGRYIDVDYPTPEKRAANLAELLTLSADQKDKVQAIFVEQDKQAMALWSDESLTADARTRKIDDARDAAVRKIRDLLTDEQKKKYDALAVEEKPAK